MNVKCPSCETVYRVDPTKVPVGGIRARCATCGAILSVQQDRQGKPVESSAEPVAGEIGAAALGGFQVPSAFEEPAAIETEVSTPKLEIPEPPEVPMVPEVAPPSAERPDISPPQPVRSETTPEPAAPAEPEPSEPPMPAIGLVRDESPALEPSAPEEELIQPAPEPPDIRPPEPPSLQVPEPPQQHREPARPRRLSKPFFRPGATPEAAPSKPARPSAPVFKPAPDAPAQPATPVPEPKPAPSAGPEPEAASKKPVNPFLSRDPKQKARRLARALVSDMIVYQPKKRQDAIQSGTLKDDFEEEIQKSWEEYVGQVGEEMANSTSFWKEALNEILAGGREIF